MACKRGGLHAHVHYYNFYLNLLIRYSLTPGSHNIQVTRKILALRELRAGDPGNPGVWEFEAMSQV